MAAARRRATDRLAPIKTSCALAVLLLALTVLLTGCAAPESTGRKRPETFSFWPPFPDEPRMQFLVSYQYSDDVEPARSGIDDLIYGEERRVLPINKPYGVEMRDGRIYVCDTRNAGVIILDLRKQETRLMGTSGMGRMSSPTDVAIAPDGMIYVSDAARGAIFVFNAEERHVASFGWPDFRPTGIAVHGDELYACDFVTQQVQVLDRRAGDRRRTIGEKGDQDGQFVRPLGIDVDSDGNVYVTDVIRCRVQKFSPAGELLGAFGGIGDVLGAFVRPKHLAVDDEGVVYVVDAGFANIQMFNRDNRLLMFFGAAGTHPGAMYLPAGVCAHEGDLDLFEEYIHPAFDARRLVLVTNQFGPNKVSVYAFGRLREGHTVQDIATSRAAMESGLAEEYDAETGPGQPAPAPPPPDEETDQAPPPEER
ncbi:MAG: SMP-30/gluconolactonase/LRE family protein [Planctomycetota bacterium]|nr:SMP-30/gluconolactonase/LRE family protein [Planctomycetota bacterium]